MTWRKLTAEEETKWLKKAAPKEELTFILCSELKERPGTPPKKFTKRTFPTNKAYAKKKAKGTKQQNIAGYYKAKKASAATNN